MPKETGSSIFHPGDIRGTQRFITKKEFCQFKGITGRTFKRRRNSGKLVVFDGQIGRNGSPIPMVSIEQLSPAGFERWAEAETAKVLGRAGGEKPTPAAVGSHPSQEGNLGATVNPSQEGNLGATPKLSKEGNFGPTPNPSKEGNLLARRSGLWGRYERAKNPQKEEAQRRLKAVQEMETLIDQGTAKPKAREIVAGQVGESAITLYRWMKAANKVDRSDRLPALVPRYAGCQVTGEIPVEAWDYFKADYLRLEQPAASACYERLTRIAEQQRWEIPGCATFLAKIRCELPRQVLILAREGKQALKRSYPYQQRDHSVFDAFEAVCPDGHEFDLRIEFPDGEVRRSMACFWQDIYSGMILSRRVDKTMNRDMVRLSAGDMIEKFGIPRMAYADNGREFACKWLTGGMEHRFRFKVKSEDPNGIFTQLGVKVSWATPHWGQAKPIERAFRDFCEYIARHPKFTGAYTGNSPTTKPESYGSRAIPLAEFLEVLDTEIAAHNARLGRRTAVCKGRSFGQTFQESYQKSTIRKATAEQRRLWLLAVEGVMASRMDGSITLQGNRFWSEFLSEQAGRRVVVRFDPQNLRGDVHVETLEGAYLGQASCIEAAGFSDTEAAREHARLRNQNMKSAKLTLSNERRMSAIEAGRLLPTFTTPEPPAAKVVRPYFATGTDGALPASRSSVLQADTNEADENFTRFINSLKPAWDEEEKERI